MAVIEYRAAAPRTTAERPIRIFLNDAPVAVGDKALFITGRISCEMALKAHRAGCPVLVSRKSATDEAARRAEELGVTLVSHCRDGRLRVLSCPDRIAG